HADGFHAGRLTLRTRLRHHMPRMAVHRVRSSTVREQIPEDARAFAVPKAVHVGWSEVALESRDHRRHRYIDVRRHAVAQAREIVRSRLSAAVYGGGAERSARGRGGSRPHANSVIRELLPRKQLAGISLPRRRHIGMTDDSFPRDRMARKNPA